MKFYKSIFLAISLITLTFNSFAYELTANLNFKRKFAQVTRIQGDLIDMGYLNGYPSKKILTTPLTIRVMEEYTTDWAKVNYNSSYLSFTTNVDYDFNPSYQCVGFIKVATSVQKSAGSYWYKFNESNISESNRPKPYSVIATFNEKNEYEGHTALVLGSNNEGVFVVDQNWHSDGEILFHFIPYGNESDKKPGSAGVGSGVNYYVVGVK